jgi:arylsulfatase A-like enzyme
VSFFIVSARGVVARAARRAAGAVAIGCLSAVITAMPIARAAGEVIAGCPCDCHGEGRVTITDLILAVRIALGIAPVSDCQAADQDGDGVVKIAELIAGVGVALAGCPALPTATVPPTELPPTETISPTPPASAAPSASPSPSLSPSPSASPTQTQRPNFLVIQLDDTRYDGLDRMAQLQARLLPESVTFTNSFVPLSLCCPSRASLLSGLYAVHHQARSNSGVIGGADVFRSSGTDQETIAVWLQHAGYATGLFGKYLNSYNVESNKGPGGSYYIPPGWTRWRAFACAGAQCTPEHYGGMDGPSYQLVDEQGTLTSYHDHTSDAEYSTDVTAEAVRQFIQDSTTAGQPFFALWVPYASHSDQPNLAPIPTARDLGTLGDLLNPAQLWRPLNWNEADRSDKPRWLQELPVNGTLEAATDDIRELAYETLLDVDRQLGAMLDQIDALGIADHTVVMFTSDNGVAWGEHGQFFQTKECPYEECLRVPLIIHVPGTTATGSAMSPGLNIDIAPTIADLAGVSPPVAVDGRSLRPLFTDPTQTLRDDFLLEQSRAVRGASVFYDGQPSDGDRLRLYYGRGLPKTSATFEFDSGDGVDPNSVPVVIQATADLTFQALGNAIKEIVSYAGALEAAVGDTTQCPHPDNPSGCKQLEIGETPGTVAGFYAWEDVNQSGNFRVNYPVPDFFGVRDVSAGFTYVQYEDGEAELYDLNSDPWELTNVIDDPAYAGSRAALDARMRELAGTP